MRDNWDVYFAKQARMVATRATCDRAHVGCVIVKDNHILSTGYNGSISGRPHCDDEGHMMLHNHCVRTVHAEQNAVAQAAKFGIRLFGSTAYITHSPCFQCFKILINAGIRSICYIEPKDDVLVQSLCEEMGIPYIQIHIEEEE